MHLRYYGLAQAHLQLKKQEEATWCCAFKSWERKYRYAVRVFHTWVSKKLWSGMESQSCLRDSTFCDSSGAGLSDSGASAHHTSFGRIVELMERNACKNWNSRVEDSKCKMHDEDDCDVDNRTWFCISQWYGMSTWPIVSITGNELNYSLTNARMILYCKKYYSGVVVHWIHITVERICYKLVVCCKGEHYTYVFQLLKKICFHIQNQ